MITLRKAHISDLEILLRFEQGIIEAERPFDPTMTSRHFHYYDIKQLLEQKDCAIIIAEADGKLLGSGSARILPAKPFNNFSSYAFLGFMYIHPSFRGQGINQKIIYALINWAKDRGLNEIRLQVYSQNGSAIKAYEKAGFKPFLTEMRLSH